jgi:hypothetical protein
MVLCPRNIPRNILLSVNSNRYRVAALIVSLGFCASAIMYWITAHGPGVSPDSTTYIETARNLFAGKGFFIDGWPMTHYPPVYPLLLSAVGLFTRGDMLLAARLLAAAFFGANLFLLAVAVYTCTRHNLVATGCVIFLFILSKPIISIHSMAWSEAPFIAFSMAGFILLAQHVARPRVCRLVAASLMFGVAAATRYVGIVLFPTVALALFLLSNQAFKHKIKDIFVFSGVACLPLVSWLVRNMLIAKSATNREVAFHPFNLNHAKNLIVQTYDFFLPISISAWTKTFHILVVATLFVLAARLIYRRTGIRQSTSSMGIVLPSILVIYSVLYVTFLVLSISFFDAHTPVDHRLLLPVFIALIISGTSIAKRLSEVWPHKCVWYGYVFFAGFLATINAVPAITKAVDIHCDGEGYTARYWRDSATLAYLSLVPETMTIYSNGSDVLHFLTHKQASCIPAKVSPGTRMENENYQDQMRQMIRDCEKGNALIVYLDRITWRWYLPSKKEIESLFSVPLIRTMEDGVIYGISVVQNKAEQGAALDGDSAAIHPRP